MPNDEDIDDDIIIDGDDSPNSDIDSLQNEILDIEVVDTDNEGG